jgi:hypothetical protein
VPALFVLALAGCGDNGGGGASIDPDQLVPSKRDYIVQADTVCSRAQDSLQNQAKVELGIDAKDFRVTRQGTIVFKPGHRPTAQEIERFGSSVAVPALREQMADLRALTPPSGDEAELTAIYDAADQGIDRLAKDPSLFNDRGAVQRELDRARQLGRRYGFFNCGVYSGP